MVHNTLVLQLKKVVEHAVFPVFFPVLFLVQTVDEAVVYVIRLELGKLPVHRGLYLVEIQGPGVAFARAIKRAKVHLIAYLAAHAGKGPAEGGEGMGFGCCQIKVVDAAFHCGLKNPDALLPCGKDACPKTKNAYGIACAAVDTVFHLSNLMYAPWGVSWQGNSTVQGHFPDTFVPGKCPFLAL